MSMVPTERTFAVLVEITIKEPGLRHDEGGEPPKRSLNACLQHVQEAVETYGGQMWPGHTFFPTNLRVKVR